jgi:hypothetical protein
MKATLFGAVIAAVVLVAWGQFACQKTVDTYNAFVNVGQFQNAASATFARGVQVRGPFLYRIAFIHYCCCFASTLFPACSPIALIAEPTLETMRS